MNQKVNLQTKFDLCVIGSGPAGIITVLEYMRVNPGKKALLVEYGREGQNGKNALDDSIRVTNLVNHHAPYECTNKGLGGSSLTWGGRCVMYDDIDFMDRPAVEGGCTWDINLFNEVKEYTGAAAGYFECGDPLFDLDKIPEFKETTIAENFKEGIVTDRIVERWSMPTRFGDRYKNQLLETPGLSLLQGYEARDFSSPDDTGNISSLTVRHIGTGECVKVKASHFVLAAGTQETTRILLRNKRVFDRLKTVPPALGKYYQGHVFGKIASVIFSGDPKKTDYEFLRNPDGTYIRRRFQFSTSYLLENDLLNTAIWLDNPLYYDPVHKNGAMSFMYLAMITPFLGKKLAPPAIAHSITKGKVNRVHKHLWNLVTGFPGSFVTPATIFYKRYCRKRKLPGIFLFSPKNNYALNFHSEQVPHASNRMELGPDNEELEIHYGLTDTDVNSVIKIHEALDKWLRDCDCGKLDYWFTKEELPDAIRKISKDGIHQIGTTRIGDSPEEGVVDRDLKVWGTKNLHVCSSSAFPTSGQANPTFFLGAFAVRLANHLK